MPEPLIIFDCDGVLVDSEIICCGIEAQELTQIGYPIDTQECIRRFAGKSQKTIRATVEAALGRPLPDSFQEARHAKILAALRESVKPIPGIEQALEKIRHKCIASSGTPDKIDTNLRASGLEAYFDIAQRFSAVHVANGKPAPDLFLHAAKQMGFPPAACLVIDDSIYGIQGAKAAGMIALGFTGGSHILDRAQASQALLDAGADMVFESMALLPDLIAATLHSPSARSVG